MRGAGCERENPGFVKGQIKKYYFTYLWEWQLTLIILEPETQLLIKILKPSFSEQLKYLWNCIYWKKIILLGVL